jgi:hypothetical protein
MEMDGCPTFAPVYVGRKRRGDPDFLHAALDRSACTAFFKESRMKCVEVTNCTGNPGEALQPLYDFSCKRHPEVD